jgi:short chain dehydrogenase
MAKKQFNSVRYMTWKRLLIVVATAVVLENENLPSVNATTGAFTSSWLSARCTNRICSRIGRKSAPFGNVSGTVKESLYGKDESEPMLSVAADTSDWDDRTSTHEPTSSDFLTNNSRRDFFIQAQQQASSVFLSSLILGPMAAYAQDPLMTGADTKKKTIVITGANSGIGLEACKRLAKQGHTLILACRSLDKAKEAVECIRQQETTVMGSLIPAECDLASMASIKSFAEGLPAKIRQTNQDTTTAVTIDTLCLNAGIARNTAATDCARSVDGFELTGKRRIFGFIWSPFACLVLLLSNLLLH